MGTLSGAAPQNQSSQPWFRKQDNAESRENPGRGGRESYKPTEHQELQRQPERQRRRQRQRQPAPEAARSTRRTPPAG